MNYLYKYLAVGCVLVMVSLSGVAIAAPSPDDAPQTNAAATAQTDAAPSQQLATSLADIDVASYLIRNLYREPDKDANDLDKWFRGWALSLYWNPNMAGHAENPNKDDLSMNGLGFAVSKDISPASTFRLDYSYRSSQGFSALVKRQRISLDYLFNITNFYYGYDLSRQNEWLLSMGVQAGTSMNQEGSRDTLSFVKPVGSKLGWGGVHMGIQYRKNISNDLAFFMESQFELNSDNWDGMNNKYDVDPSLNLLVGLVYRLGAPKRNIVPDDEEHHYRWYDNTFIQMYGGLSKMASNDITNGGLTFDGAGEYTGNIPGLNFGFNIGKWLNPSLGLRLGYFEQVMGHNTKPVPGTPDYSNFMTLRGGRAELLFNPLSVFADRISVGRIGWELAAGLEVGQFHLHRYGYNNYFSYHTNNPDITFDNDGKLTLGLSLSTQLKYFVNNHTALFVEGRMSDLKYNATKAGGFNADKETKESIYSASLGLEYYLSGWDRYSRFSHWDTYETRPIERLAANKRLYLEAAAGLSHQIHWGEHFPNMFDIEGTVGIGMRYNNYFGGRARFSYSYRNADIAITSVHGANPFLGRMSSIYRGSLDATFNLTNLWMGIDHAGTRLGDLYLFAGPVLAGYNDQIEAGNFDQLTIGGNVGLQLTRRLSPEWEIFLEPRYEFYMKHLTNRWDLLAGIIYNYNAEKNDEYKDELSKWANRWFMETGVGAGLDMTKSTLGGSARLGVGRRFNPFSSLRLNGMFTLVDMMDKGEYLPDEQKHSFKMGAGVDYMLNLTNLWYGVNPFRKTNLRAFVGPTFNLSGVTRSEERAKIRVGAEAGVQWSYDIARNLSLFVEPRAEVFSSAGFLSSYYNTRADVLVGATWYNDYHTWRANRLFFNDDEHYPWSLVEPGYVRPGQKEVDADLRNRNWFWEFGVGANFPMGSFNEDLGKLKLFSPAMSLGLGYQFDNYQAVRLMGSFAKLNSQLYLNDPTSYLMTASLDYRFNVTNLVMGLNPYRPMDAYLFAGPEMRMLDWTKREMRNTFALGAMGGAHLAYHLNQNLDLFAEARYTNYSVGSKVNKYLLDKDYDKMRRLHNSVTGLVGVTWYNKEFDRNILSPWDDSAHSGNWFYQAAGGLSHALLMKDKKASFAQTNSLSGFLAMGYAFTPLHSLRLDGTMHMKGDTQYDMDGKKMVASMGLDYMFNASRFILGENPYRRFDLQLLAGPQLRAVNVNSSDSETGLRFGATAGTQLNYHLNRNFDLFGEARYDFWQGKWQERADIYAGLAYYGRTQDQRTKQFITDPTARQNNWFWSAMAGVTHPMGGWADDMSGMDLFNPIYSAGLGYIWGPYSSVRLTGNFANIRNNIWPNSRRRSYLMYADLDYMFNLTNLMMGQDNYRPIDFFVLAGPSARFENFTQADEKNTFALGANIGAQLAYHFNSNIDFFGEARYENWEKFSSINNSDQHNVWDLFAGVTYYTAPLDRNRFRPYDENYRYGNWFYQGALGLSHPTLARQKGNNESAAAFLAMGYQFDKLQSLRLNATGMRHLKIDGGTDLDGRNLLASFGLDYMFNATNALLGENPYRRFDIQLLAGPAMRLVNFNNSDVSNAFIYGASAGGQLLYHLNRSFDLFGEARYDFWQGKWQERLDAFAGVTYYTKPQSLRTGNWLTDPKTHYKNWFAEASVGATLPMESTNVPGMSDKIGLGYVFSPYSIVRANMINHWHLGRSMDTKEKHKYVMAGDLEYMLNITNLMFDDAHRRIELLPFVGVAGRLENVTKSDKALHMGFGALVGGQANYHLNQYTDLFVQGQYEKWFDNNAEDRLSAYIGTRFYNNGLFAGNTTPAGRPTAQPTGKPKVRKDRDGNTVVVPARPMDVEDKKTTFVDLGLGLGGSVAYSVTGEDLGSLGKMKYVDMTLHAGAGIHFNPYLSGRARANITFVGKKHVQETSEAHSFIFETALDGMWNMTNTLLGVNPYRKLDFYAFAGPTLRFENLTDKDRNKESEEREGIKVRLGVNAGGRLAYHLNNNLDLVGEGRLDWLDRSRGYHNRYEAMAGVSMRLDNRVRKTATEFTNDRLYLQLLGGYQIASLEGTNGFKYSQSNWGKMPNLDYRIGRHFNEVWSAQASIFSQQVNYQDWKKGRGNYLQQYGLRAELAVSALTLFNTTYDAYDSRFNWLLSGGVQVSRLKNDLGKLSDFGLTVATQAQYRLTDLTWAVVEARAQQVNLDGVHMPVSLQLGVQHDLRGNAVSKKVGEAINDNRNHWQISAGAGAYNAKRGGFEGALTYRFAKNSALRLKGEAFNNGYLYPETDNKLGGYLAVGADYMANVTNLFLGIDDYRRTNLYMFGGATVVTRGFFQAIQSKDFSAIGSTFNNGVGINYGAHADVKLTKKLSVYTEARFVNLSKNTDLCDIYKDKVNLFTTVGLKYNLPK